MSTDNQIAEQVAVALQSGADLKTLVESLYTAIGAFDQPRAYIIQGTSHILVVLPGWNPLRDIADHVMLAERHA